MIRPLKLQTLKSAGKEDKGTISSRIKGGKGFKGNNRKGRGKGRQDGIGSKKGSNKPASSSAVVDDGSDSPANYYKTDDEVVAPVTANVGGKRFNKAPVANPGVVTNTSNPLRRPTAGQSQLPGKGPRAFGGIRTLKSQHKGTKPPQVQPQRMRLALGAQPQGQRPLAGQKIALGTKLALGQRPPRVQGKGEKSAKSSQGQTTEAGEVKKPVSILPGRKLDEKPIPVPAGVKKSIGMRTPIAASTGVAAQINRTKLAFKKPLPNNVRNPPRVINQRPASVSATAPIPKPQLNKLLRPNRPASLGQFQRPGVEVRSQAAQANSNSSSSNSRPVISQFKSVKTVIKQQLKGGVGAIRPTMKQQLRKIPSTLGAVQRNTEQAQPAARRVVPAMQTPMGKPLLNSNLSSFNKNTSASSKMGVNTAPVVEAAKFPKKSVGLQKPMLLKVRTQDAPQVSAASQASSRPPRVVAPSTVRSLIKPTPSASAIKPAPSASATKPQPSAPAAPVVPVVRKTERFPPTGRVAQKVENRFPRVPPARALPYVPGKIVAPPLNRTSDRPTSKSTSVAATKFLNQK